jgi:hypothetical protein
MASSRKQRAMQNYDSICPTFNFDLSKMESQKQWHGLTPIMTTAESNTRGHELCFSESLLSFQ